MKSHLNGARHKPARAGGRQAGGGVRVRLRADLGGVRAMESGEADAVQAVGGGRWKAWSGVGRGRACANS